jgi:hypothetical protein
MSAETKKNNEWQERELGALWKKESTTQKYLSGHVKVDDGMGGEETLQLIIFANKHKQKDNHPDFRIYKSTPLQKKSTSEQQVPASEQQVPAREQQVPASETVPSEVQEVPEEHVL